MLEIWKEHLRTPRSLDNKRDCLFVSSFPEMQMEITGVGLLALFAHSVILVQSPTSKSIVQMETLFVYVLLAHVPTMQVWIVSSAFSTFFMLEDLMLRVESVRLNGTENVFKTVYLTP